LANGISNERIDRLYQLALEHGASGGKIAGAGGGGFLLLFCEPEHQPAVTQVLEGEGLTRMTFHFDDGGAQVLVNSMPEIPGLEYPEGRWVGSGVASV
jgi:D-glycero-alpha-D-manno-heptose-7-phosphate kinase